ncbi:unnamed protein product [Hydatigera taeniaeformis]|uniref:non-specific serine/threonine protein kinase n=1 Tax=Hydatigena taeniaeformis TaxID=6205 RepID=A0A0R3WKM4_HYDTA|nr:unnamed protein product [Hydatigera taeniaeformis]
MALVAAVRGNEKSAKGQSGPLEGQVFGVKHLEKPGGKPRSTRTERKLKFQQDQQHYSSNNIHLACEFQLFLRFTISKVNRQEFDRSPFREGDKLPRISSDAVTFRAVQVSPPWAARMPRESMTERCMNFMLETESASCGHTAPRGFRPSDDQSVARLSVSIVDTSPSVARRCKRYRSHIAFQMPTRIEIPQRQHIHRNYRSVYDGAIVSERRASLTPPNGYETPSTWSQLEQLQMGIRCGFPNSPRAQSRPINTLRTLQPQFSVRRAADPDGSLKVKPTSAKTVPQRQTRNRVIESKSLNHLKTLVKSDDFSEDPASTPLQRSVRQKFPPIPVANYSVTQLKNLLSKEVDPGDPRSLLKELGTIGEGSTSVVKLARRSLDGALVAVKKMKIANQQRPELLINEAVLMRTFSHPNIVKMFSCYLVNDDFWVVMEFMDCGALTSFISHTRLSEKQIATLSIPILSALAFLHSNGIIHRDVKSDSILLASDFKVKLSDFGFCATVCLVPCL